MPDSDTHATATRLAALDGMRCLAVLMVMAFHYLHYWTPAGSGEPLLAYGSAFASVPFAATGYLGVQLFFIISGFVIFLTLERCASPREFLVRRAIRLWPPLVLMGTLTFAVVTVLGPPALHVSMAEYALSLLILPPQNVGAVLGFEGWRWLDGAYWSLWTEVRFYAVFGALYFISRADLLRNWLVFEIGAFSIAIAAKMGFDALPLRAIEGLLFQQSIPYFSFGIASYLAYTGRRDAMTKLVAAVAVVHASINFLVYLHAHDGPEGVQAIEALLLHGTIFVLVYQFAWRGQPMTWLTWKPLVVLGQASYGMYLLHQNVGVTILHSPLFADAAVAAAAIIAVTSFVALFAVLSYRYCERPLQLWLAGAVLPVRPGRQLQARTVAAARGRPMIGETRL